jgi:hypothetical protein
MNQAGQKRPEGSPEPDHEPDERGPEEGPQPDYEPPEPNPYADEDLVLDSYVFDDDGATEPDPSEFDPMAMSTWSWFMVLAWIGWRTSEDVQKCCDEYRANSWRYRTETTWLTREETPRTRRRLGGPIRPVDKRVFRSDGPMNGLTFTNMAVVKADRLRMPIKAAERELKDALVKDQFTASAADATTGRPIEIPAFEWAHIEVNDKGEIYFRKSPGWIAYNDVHFMRADVTSCWPKNAQQEQLTSVLPAKTIKRTSERIAREAVAQRIKDEPGLTATQLEEFRKSIGASREVARDEWRKARNEGARPVKRGRPSKD